MDIQNAKYLVVGAGFFGAVIAERIANDLNEPVILIDRRKHIGGNSYSEIDSETGIEFHTYGSHIFHTSIKEVWDYINKFCSFNDYRHQVLTTYKDKVYQMPINLHTINSYYGINLKPYEVEEFLNNEVANENITKPSNLEEKAISLIGRPLYEAFIKGYNIKHWDTDPRILPESIITRLPVRSNYNYYYFGDKWQGIPLEGYYKVFENMLATPNIFLKLDLDFKNIKNIINKDCKIIYTGPIDEYFDYKYGKLGWRTLKFEAERHNVADYQGTTVMNYAEASIPFTRIHEFKHYHPERSYTNNQTLIFKEYSMGLNSIYREPYYPINTDKDKEILKVYNNEASGLNNVIFGGRLGLYRYLDMDKTIHLALKIYEEQIKA
ncbi:MAG: UDP-galactopyranose mutase [Cyanobacteriota bacterium]